MQDVLGKTIHSEMEPNEGNPVIEFSRLGLLRVGSALPGTPKDICRTQITKKTLILATKSKLKKHICICKLAC